MVGTSVLLSISVNIFLANPFLVAYNGFVLLNSSGAEIGSGVVWRIFKENYLNVVKTMFLRDLFVTLWGIPLYAGVALAYVSALFVNKNPAVAVILYGIAFIFIVGGGVLELYKQYSYSMTEYLLAENTGITAGEALGQSKTLMRGYTFFAFKLDISFVGWYLLGVLLCGIGTFFVKPYEAATKAQFYMALKREQGYC